MLFFYFFYLNVVFKFLPGGNVFFNLIVKLQMKRNSGIELLNNIYLIDSNLPVKENCKKYFITPPYCKGRCNGICQVFVPDTVEHKSRYYCNCIWSSRKMQTEHGEIHIVLAQCNHTVYIYFLTTVQSTLYTCTLLEKWADDYCLALCDEMFDQFPQFDVDVT